MVGGVYTLSTTRRRLRPAANSGVVGAAAHTPTVGGRRGVVVTGSAGDRTAAPWRRLSGPGPGPAVHGHGDRGGELHPDGGVPGNGFTSPAGAPDGPTLDEWFEWAAAARTTVK